MWQLAICFCLICRNNNFSWPKFFKSSFNQVFNKSLPLPAIVFPCHNQVLCLFLINPHRFRRSQQWPDKELNRQVEDIIVWSLISLYLWLLLSFCVITSSCVCSFSVLIVSWGLCCALTWTWAVWSLMSPYLYLSLSFFVITGSCVCSFLILIF